MCFPNAALPRAMPPVGPADRDTPLASGLRLDAGADNKKPGPPTRFSVSDVRVAETVRKYSVAYLTMTFAPTLARL